MSQSTAQHRPHAAAGDLVLDEVTLARLAAAFQQVADRLLRALGLARCRVSQRDARIDADTGQAAEQAVDSIGGDIGLGPIRRGDDQALLARRAGGLPAREFILDPEFQTAVSAGERDHGSTLPVQPFRLGGNQRRRVHFSQVLKLFLHSD